jgi:hypothetical protein
VVLVTPRQNRLFLSAAERPFVLPVGLAVAASIVLGLSSTPADPVTVIDAGSE